jgi:hypothetical protein
MEQPDLAPGIVTTFRIAPHLDGEKASIGIEGNRYGILDERFVCYKVKCDPGPNLERLKGPFRWYCR